MRKVKENIKQICGNLRNIHQYKNSLIFLSFVAVSALLWFIMVLNDNVQTTVHVGINIYNKPDSVIFISDVPNKIEVSLKDKGTNLLRKGLLHNISLDINFNEYAHSGVLRYSRENLYAGIRKLFGNTAQISGISVDSIYVPYAGNRGKRVPIEFNYDISAKIGNIISGKPKLSQKYAYVYSSKEILDTITRVYTNKLVERNLTESKKVTVNLIGIRGAKIVPSSIEVDIPVEHLVSKTASFMVKPINVPEDISVLLFPDKINVTYFVPMSEYNSQQDDMEIVADYAQAQRERSRKLPVSVRKAPKNSVNVRTQIDSLEFTVVR